MLRAPFDAPRALRYGLLPDTDIFYDTLMQPCLFTCLIFAIFFTCRCRRLFDISFTMLPPLMMPSRRAIERRRLPLSLPLPPLLIYFLLF